MIKLKDMKETNNATEVHAVVIENSNFLGLNYKHKGRPYTVELPKTHMNEDLQIDDEVILSLYRLVEVGA